MIQYFAEFGTITEGYIVFDKESSNSRCFGFIEFDMPEVAEHVNSLQHTIDFKKVVTKFHRLKEINKSNDINPFDLYPTSYCEVPYYGPQEPPVFLDSNGQPLSQTEQVYYESNYGYYDQYQCDPNYNDNGYDYYNNGNLNQQPYGYEYQPYNGEPYPQQSYDYQNSGHNYDQYQHTQGQYQEPYYQQGDYYQQGTLNHQGEYYGQGQGYQGDYYQQDSNGYYQQNGNQYSDSGYQYTEYSSVPQQRDVYNNEAMNGQSYTHENGVQAAPENVNVASITGSLNDGSISPIPFEEKCVEIKL